ncbi:hypothetical protein GUJ93_ZPchr0010g8648 [Zizania palustris]|uniref:Uncharacterized protein n=1 Tax=Zizania palustris TaxID=103762 RepID=A0A8J5WES9_ZIZPA|nr:hypothetical protein GUJ93_ZPchr0010g8648 [Zizania palustris]
MAATASSDRASECPHLAQRLSPPLICHTFKGMLSDNGEVTATTACCSRPTHTTRRSTRARRMEMVVAPPLMMQIWLSSWNGSCLV